MVYKRQTLPDEERHIMQADEMAARISDQAVKIAEPPTLAERVEKLESYLASLSEQVDNNSSAIGRVGSRLSRAENHVGLPSTDV